MNAHHPLCNPACRGLVTEADGPLNERRGQYQPVVRQPIRHDRRGFKVVEHRKDQAPGRVDQFKE